MRVSAVRIIGKIEMRAAVFNSKIFRYNRIGLIVLAMLAFPAYSHADSEIPAKMVSYRIGFGHSFKPNSTVLDKPLEGYEPQSETVIPKKCFSKPGITGSKVPGDDKIYPSRNQDNLIRVLRGLTVKRLKINFLCGEKEFSVTTYLEKSDDGKNWEIWRYPSNQVIDILFSEFVNNFNKSNNFKGKAILQESGGISYEQYGNGEEDYKFGSFKGRFSAQYVIPDKRVFEVLKLYVEETDGLMFANITNDEQKFLLRLSKPMPQNLADQFSKALLQIFTFDSKKADIIHELQIQKMNQKYGDNWREEVLKEIKK